MYHMCIGGCVLYVQFCSVLVLFRTEPGVQLAQKEFCLLVKSVSEMISISINQGKAQKIEPGMLYEREVDELCSLKVDSCVHFN